MTDPIDLTEEALAEVRSCIIKLLVKEYPHDTVYFGDSACPTCGFSDKVIAVIVKLIKQQKVVL